MSRSTPRVSYAALLGLALAVFTTGINVPARGQDMNQLNRQYDDARGAGRYGEAEQVARQGIEVATALRKETWVAYWWDSLGVVLVDQGREAEAVLPYRRALAVYEKAGAPERLNLANGLNHLANAYSHLARYAEAEPLYKRALAIQEEALGVDHPRVAYTLCGLAILYQLQGRYAEAEPLYKRSLAIREKVLGADHPDVAWSLSGLAAVYDKQGRYAEAEPLYKRALAIFEKALGADHPAVAAGLNNLADLYGQQGRYAEAEPLYKRSLAILEKALGADHPDVATSLNHLANLYVKQGRYAEAEPLLKRSLAIREKTLGADHPAVAMSLQSLANLDVEQGRYAEAEPLYKRTLAIWEKALGADHPAVATSLDNLASLYYFQGRDAEAEPLRKRSLAIFEKALGADHPDVAVSLHNLAVLYFAQGRYAEAEPLLDRAVAIRDRAGAAPGARFLSYSARACCAWKLGRREDALADMRQALDLAELQRGKFSGAGHEHAEAFGEYLASFEQMVAWQAELGSPGEAFAAIERAHARTLLDDLGMAGHDFQVGRSAAERAEAGTREGELKAEVAGGEKRLDLAKDDAGRAAASAALAEARAALYAFYRDERNSNPVYRNLIASGSGPPRLSQVQRRLPEGSRLLVYLIGDENGYVVSADAKAARVVVLSVPEAEAKVLGVKAGPLNAKQLQAIVLGSERDGVAPRLANPKTAEGLTPKLAALWRVLVPEAERAALLDGSVRTLFVVPDGALGVVPFEALVVDEAAAGGPKYLLDAGPAVAYGPSATVLSNLLARPPASSRADEPVLALGDPVYPGAEPAPVVGGPVLLTSRGRYRGAGGSLARLPYSGWEAEWVAKAFGDRGIKAGLLVGPAATEARLRQAVPGRRLLHLACHGLTDPSFSNFYGALALTPGPNGADDLDDGFLRLEEIRALDLKSCELAILSACETNYGPRQRGEGTSALSRGFLIAGARRVVASNWVVDDEAAASLVSVTCSWLADAEKAGKPMDHARALREAKRWVRNQEKWRSPYYWASLVLVGPP